MTTAVCYRVTGRESMKVVQPQQLGWGALKFLKSTWRKKNLSSLGNAGSFLPSLLHVSFPNTGSVGLILLK